MRGGVYIPGARWRCGREHRVVLTVKDPNPVLKSVEVLIEDMDGVNREPAHLYISATTALALCVDLLGDLAGIVSDEEAVTTAKAVAARLTPKIFDFPGGR